VPNAADSDTQGQAVEAENLGFSVTTFLQHIGFVYKVMFGNIIEP
jgi:hypothetical protein